MSIEPAEILDFSFLRIKGRPDRLRPIFLGRYFKRLMNMKGRSRSSMWYSWKEFSPPLSPCMLQGTDWTIDLSGAFSEARPRATLSRPQRLQFPATLEESLHGIIAKAWRTENKRAGPCVVRKNSIHMFSVFSGERSIVFRKRTLGSSTWMLQKSRVASGRAPFAGCVEIYWGMYLAWSK